MYHNRLPPWLDKEDIQQAVALARLEAERLGFDPDLAAEAAYRELVRDEWDRGTREVPISIVAGSEAVASVVEEWVQDARKVVGIRPPRKQTEGQRKRFVRDQAILALAVAGFPQRAIAGIVGLPQSRITVILDQMRSRLRLSQPTHTSQADPTPEK